MCIHFTVHFYPERKKFLFSHVQIFFLLFLSENSGILLATKSWSKMDSHLTELFSCEGAALEMLTSVCLSVLNLKF